MTKSLKIAVCASLLLGSVYASFASTDPIDQAVEQLLKPAQDAIADHVQQAVESEQVQEAAASVTETITQKIGEVTSKAKDGLKEAGDVILGKGAEFSEWAKEGVSKAKDGLKDAGNAVLEKGSEFSGWAKEGTSKAYNAALDKVAQIKATAAYNKVTGKFSEALTWVEGKTPEQIKVWVANHPYLTVTAVVTPIALYIGYKLGKAKPAKDQENNNQ